MNFILLAAGFGKRMGGNKALMNFNGKPWALTQLQQIAEAGLTKTLLVTNPDSAMALTKILSQIPSKFLPQTTLLTNPYPEKGPFSSLQLAIAAGLEESSFLCPIDVPLSAKTLKIMRRSWRQTHEIEALIPLYQERKGHPVILSSNLQRSLLCLSSDSPEARLDFILKSLPENKKRILTIEDPNIIKNLNTPEDLIHEILAT
ncbi:MAG TPA: nucleotidyltransferase family protein [Pseudobdellovibrionaceae bacterium]